MVRETRHLWVGNLPDNIREDRIREHFKRYGRVQNVKLLGRTESMGATTITCGIANSGICAAVAFMDIKSASKAHNAEHVLDERTLTTEYYEPTAIPSAAGAPSAGSSPAGSGYSGSSSSVNSVPAPVTSTTNRYHLSGSEDSPGNACLASAVAAPATWRGTNDSASEFCRRGSTPATYSRNTPHHRWYASGSGGSGERAGTATGGESTPSTPGGGTESGRRRRLSGSGSSRSDSSSPEPSDNSRSSTPLAPHTHPHHNNHRPPTAHPHQWASTANGRPLAICVRNLPTRSTDSSLKDGLYHEYKKHGKVVWVKVVGQNADRYAVVRFKKPSDVEKALEVSQDKLFFGCKISVAPHQSCDEDADSAKPYETDIDEYHPKATRTLFIGNLEKDVTPQQLRDKFKHFGRIIEIDIKKGSGGGAGYAFCQYASISSVVEAIRAMDGEHVGGSRVKLGFGKPVATTCVWVDGLTEHTEKQVLGAVSRGCGMATSVCVDRAAGAALVHFEQAAAAGAAVRELRRVAAQLSAAEPDHPRLCVDYASRECQEAFYEQLEKHGGSAALTGSERLSGDLTTRYAPTTRHEPLRYERCGSRSRGSSYGRSTSRNPRFSTLEHYDPADYAADRRYRVFDEMGSSPQAEDVPYEDRLQSVVVSPHRARRHRRDSSPEERKHSKERHWSVSVSSARRSRSGSRGAERHGARRRHRRRRDGSRSPRAGTPLRDEPEPRDAAPCEPRRPPRERPPLPMCLPLPKFAALLLRPATAAPRAAPEPTPDAPAAPASPPRPPSASSSSAGSAPHSPSLEERIRSLDEKYEKWNGCRSLGDPPDRTRLRHRLLEVDINEVKPSDVVRSLLAKRSVFDEDSERLEGAARAPSPTCSPRSRPSPCVPRALRYPFPSHLSPASSSSQTFVPISDVDGEIEKADRPADPRLNRPERPYLQERLAKFNESDYRLETRIRMRTPSTDKAATESRDCISSPLAEKERSVTGASEQKLDNEERRRESFTGSDISFDVNIKETREILNSTMTPDRRAESMQEYSSDKDFNSDKNKTNDLVQEGNIDHRIENIIYRNSEDNNVVELTSSIKHDSESIKHEPQVQSEDNSSDIFLTKQETCIKLEVSDEIKPKLDSSKKIDYSKFHIRKDEKCSDLFVQTCNIKKEILDHELQQNHLSTLNSIEIADLSQELVKSCDKNGKERYNNILGVYQNIKVEKENIDFEISEKDNYSSNTHFSMERRLSDIEKSIEDCMKLDKERTMKEYKERQSIDKNDSEKDKFKNHKTNVDTEHHDKEKKQKHDSVNPKPHVNKIDNVKSDNMERTPKDHELEKHKTSDEKSRHDQHRKDKIEKDRRKDSFEGDSCPSKSKREDKYKHDKLVDKSKKDYCDSKRDGKRESETIRSRKSSKDEVPKEICRKDSTDSSSKASHDLPKLKDIVDNNEVKEDERSEPKNNNESCNKSRTDKSSTIKSSDALKSSETDNNVKNDKSEEKITIDEGVKIKNDATEAISKSKVEITEKHRHYSVDSPSLDSKRKERLNSCSSLPSSIGHKRRMSSQDSLDTAQEDVKKLKSDSKCMERRDSKDMRHPDRHKTTKFNKGHFAKIIESKTKDDKKTQVKPPDDTLVDWKESETKDRKTFEKTKTKKSPKENYESNKFGCLAMPLDNNQSEGLQNDLDFLATLQLRSSEEDEKQKALRKEMKEKKRIQQLQQIQQLQMQQDALQQAEMLNKMKDDKKQKLDEKKRDLVREKRMSLDRKSRDDKIDNNKRKNRKSLQSTDSSDSDEPKKHSIFDIVDDGPTYISMYDKVKARSCKNMQKQEEEKRQEKIKAKFSQLKQSRAKREEKKRSSWDEDSDSGLDRRKSQKMSMDSSSEDEEANIKKRERVPAPTSSFRNRNDGYFSEDDSRNKLSRKNSTRIISDTSEDETSKRSASKSPSYSNNVNKESMFHTESLYPRKDADSAKELRDVKIKKNSLLNLFGKSDSDDSKLKSNSEADKTNFIDFSSESETTLSRTYSGEIRRKHKKKTKKHKVSLSDDDKKLDNSDLSHEHKQSQKSRRHSNKKEKRKEKIRDSVDTDENRDERMKLKKSKKPNNYFDGGPEFAPNIKKEDRMEDIFGPLSDESDDNAGPQNDKIVFSSHDYDSKVSLSSDQTIDGNKIKEKEDNKRKKEKKRKEKRYLVKEDENSLDVDAVSKAIEARLFAYALSDCDNTKTVPSTDVNHQECQQKTENNCADVDMSLASSVGNKDFEKTRKESREKKKKKKKNREDRQNRKDYNHPQNYEKLDKLDQLSPEKSNENLVEKTILSDIPLPTDSQMTTQDELETHSSLPNLLESPSLSEKDSDIAETKNVSHTVENAEYIIKTDNSTETAFAENKAIEVDTIPMPPPLENMVDDISKVPLPEDPAPNQLDHKVEESFIHPSSTDINVSENAVRSISNLDEDKVQASDKPDTLSIKVDEKPEEKPRATISQEETEDAVAALLGESFRGKVNTFEDCYEKTENISNHGIESSILENENIPEQDAEEMRQAVQNLNASEMEVKPDTPVSDSDLLLIDTDTEDAEESTQDAIDKLPVNIIATNQSLTTNTEKSKSIELSTLSIPKVKTNIVSAVTSEAIPVAKLNDKEMKYPSPKRDTIQHIASTASSIIPTWALTNTKLLEPHVLNIQKNALSSISKTTPENKTTHITANIVQLKSPTQNIQMSNSLRPIISPNRVTTPYQVVNQMIRPQTPSMQPPTIKIPSESHILYQKPSGIVISPRISNDPRLQSPKTNRQGETITSPRLGNMTILSTPQNMNSIGLASPTMQQRSPGQVTVVKMQQPPLSPLQGMHLPHGARTMLSPTRPNSVLVQTQGAPIHFNRLPLTPVLAPISKQISAGETLQTKGVNVSNSSIIHQTIITEGKKSEPRNISENVNENSKIILSPNNFKQNSNPTVMAQNRLISMQNSLHVGNINTSLHLPNKVLVNSINQLNDKREPPKLDQLNQISFGSPSMIHVTGVNPSTGCVIQSSAKPIVCSIQEGSPNRGQNPNVIHALSSPRLLTTPISKVLQIDANKTTPSVLSMATIRSPTVLTRLGSSNCVAATTPSLTSVVMTPLLLKSTSSNIRLHPQNDVDHIESQSTLHNQLPKENEDKLKEKNIMDRDEFDSAKKSDVAATIDPNITKCDTDFEELLKDNTNEIKVSNDPDKKLEVNVGKSVTLFSPCVDKIGSHGNDQDNIVPSKENSLDVPVSQDKENNIFNGQLENESSGVSAITITTEVKQDENNQNLIVDKTSEITNENSNSKHDQSPIDEVKAKLEPSDPPIGKENHVDLPRSVSSESVIKKVDSVCNESFGEQNEVKEVNSKDLNNSIETNACTLNKEVTSDLEQDNNKMEIQSVSNISESTYLEEFIAEKPISSGKRGGRSMRGKKNEKNLDRVQTRQISKPGRGTATKRGRGRGKVDKKIKNLVNNSPNNIPGDVYDFHEDSGDETSSPKKSENRPRLILTIKSPLSGQSNAIATSTLSIQKDQIKAEKSSKEQEKPEDFNLPSGNTRKSRRLLEKDVQKSTTVDDIVEDGVKILTTQTKVNKESGKKRSARQAGVKASKDREKISGSDTRKSPRGVKRSRNASLSDGSMDSSDEKLNKKYSVKDPKIMKLQEQTPSKTEIPEVAVKPHMHIVTNSNITTTPIMKPPKKMISEISAKLASVLENTTSTASIRTAVVSSVQSVCDNRMERTAQAEFDKHAFASRDLKNMEFTSSPSVSELKTATAEALPEQRFDDIRYTHRVVDNVPGHKMPVGATEASDARVQSPALPHRPSATHRPGDRATPLSISIGEGESAGCASVGPSGVGGVGVVAGGGGSVVAALGAAGRGARPLCAAASLPRGAHQPLAPLGPPGQLGPQQPHAPAPLAPHAAHVPPAPLQPRAPLRAKQVAVVGPHHHHQHPSVTSRVAITGVPANSPQSQMAMGDGMYPHFSHQHYQMYQQHFHATQHENRPAPSSPYTRPLEEGCEAPAPPPPLELRRPPGARVPRPAHSPADRIMYAVGCGRSPPPAHGTSRLPGALPPLAAPSPPHASQVPHEADSLQNLLTRYPVMWQGLLALKNDAAAVQMHFVDGNPDVAGDTLPRHTDGSTPPLRIAQRMRLEPLQLDQVHRKMMLGNEHCILLALPCGRDHMDVLQQSNNLTTGFITYLQRKQAAGIVNVAPPGHQQPMYTVHIFPSCDFANENLNRIAPDLMHRVANIAHLLIVIATV